MKKRAVIFSLVLLSLFTFINIIDAGPKLIKGFPSDEKYSMEWKEIDSLVDARLPESANKLIDRIYEHAKKNNRHAQVVKSLFYSMRMSTYKDEEAIVKVIHRLEDEIKGAQYPLKPLLHSIAAEAYWRYYQDNRWKIYQRSETSEFINDDIRTWSLKQIVNRVTEHYNTSLENTEELKKYSTKTFEDVMYTYGESERLRPTLYDFIAHRAIDFMMNTEPDITYPAYKFQLDKAEYFDITPQFTKLVIPSKDTLTLKFHAIKIYQDLEKFHFGDLDNKKPEAADALVDLQLKRLQFVYDNSTLPNKDSLYVQSLRKLGTTYPNNTEAARAYYNIARYIYDEASDFNAQTAPEYKDHYIKAKKLAEWIISKYPDTKAQYNARSLIKMIGKRELSFKMEKETLVNQDFFGRLDYRNIDTLYFRLIKTSPKQLDDIKRSWDYKEFVNQFKDQSPLRKWTQILPNPGDYHNHSVEFPVEKLESGLFVLMAGTKKDMDTDGEAVAYTIFNTTNLTYVSRHNRSEYKKEFRVYDRPSGLPVNGAKIQAYKQEYHQLKRKYIWQKKGTYTSDKEGYFELEEGDKYHTYRFEVSYGNDTYYNYSNTEHLNRKYEKTSYRRARTHFFMDRAIYRPGQTIYFKGLMTEADDDGENPKILTNHSSTVTFYDVNWQQIAQVPVTTNEFGTFNGTFTAPVGRLNGRMHIENGYGSQYFRVEEYKRPKFEVKANPAKGTYRLDDSVTVTGNAKALAGFNIDGAAVSYRITRKTNYPSWCWWWYYRSSPTMEIMNGTTETDENGEYSITFKAIPDPTAEKKNDPSFTYTVNVDVTDLNGETRSTEHYLRIGYKALEVDVKIGEMLDKTDKNEFKLSTTNLAGEHIDSKGDISIFQLKDPGVAYTNRQWERPDLQMLNKEEFTTRFPNYAFEDEDNFKNWKKGKKVYAGKFNTGVDKNLKINDLKSWRSGAYVLEISSVDKYGEVARNIKYLKVFSPKDKTVPLTTVEWINMVKTKGEPGEKAVYQIGSSEKIKVLYEIEHKNEIVSRKWIDLNNNIETIEIPISEKHRGNFGVHFSFVKNNRFYNTSSVITVPRTDKQLDIEFETFRDKLLPGAKEEWKIKVKGKNGDKVAAEMVATLYDASLDQFAYHSWGFNIFNSYYNRLGWTSSGFESTSSRLAARSWQPYMYTSSYTYNRLNWFGFSSFRFNYWYNRERKAMEKSEGNTGAFRSLEAPSSTEEVMEVEEEAAELDGFADEVGKASTTTGLVYNDQNTADLKFALEDKEKPGEGPGKPKPESKKPQIRKNFNETAFFYPHLQTDSEGNIIIKFTIPEALTKWKMIGFAHTKELASGITTNELVTQKEIMVNPFAPRFFREGDKIVFTTKVSNVSEEDLNGTVQLEMLDAISMKPVNEKLSVKNATQTITLKKAQSKQVAWTLKIPDDLQAITYRIIAKAGKHSDGEEKPIPVLTNRMLVTESLPLPVRGGQTKNYTLNKLVNNKSKTLKHHKLTLEFTSNPTWYAVQALPYLIEYPYECAEQTYSRYYANSIASHIANSSPRIKQVFDTWKNSSPEAFLSNLEKNQELKQVMLEETPWVLNAQNESERKKRVALLFDLNRMADEMGRAMNRLEQLQLGNGGFPWFDGMPDSRWITQHITCGFGKMEHLGIKHVHENRVKNMMDKSVRYLDDRIREDYEELLRLEKKGSIKLSDDHVGYTQIHYLCTRSFYKDIDIKSKNKEAFDYYFEQAKKYWTHKQLYANGMIALVMHRYGESKTASNIIKSLRERSLTSEEMGMYWKEMTEGGYYWYQAPIESQALMVEVFDEVANDDKAVDDLKVWLLKNKQTNDWKTTKATVEACYALLLRGGEWLEVEEMVEIKLGDQVIDPKKMDDVKVEAGTGYFKTSWSGSDIKPNMGNVTVKKESKGVAWGALYWQYFEQLDKITPAETPLKLNKKVFIEKNTDTGPVIEPIKENTPLKPGDRLIVRIELRSDRAMEYIHMKDMRASGLEPENVISRYKWQDGLGYYESTKDASTNFFMGYLPKGTYVFEYPLRVTHEGDFSNGITTIQCMYAPEFSSHSEGIRIKVKKD